MISTTRSCDEIPGGRPLTSMRFLVAFLLVGACSSTSSGPCVSTCDGCCTAERVCVPLAQTSQTECGRAGGPCQRCGACDQGRCSTGLECFGPPPPPVCECGRASNGVGPFPVCYRDCGSCSGGLVCVDNRCVASDGGVSDAGTTDGGADAGADGG